MSDEFDSLLDKGVSVATAAAAIPGALPLNARVFPPAGDEEDQQRRDDQTDAALLELVELPVQPPGGGGRERPPRGPHAPH